MILRIRGGNVKLGMMAVVAVLAGAMTIAAAQQTKKSDGTNSTAGKGNAALIARGKYLVGPAGKCEDCHTPMDRKGQPIQSQALQGAPIMFKPTVPVPGWADSSLPIAGLPTMASDADALSFFTTGKHLDGKMAAPPMPQYHFNKRDAEAIIAYLKSLGK